MPCPHVYTQVYGAPPCPRCFPPDVSADLKAALAENAQLKAEVGRKAETIERLRAAAPTPTRTPIGAPRTVDPRKLMR